MPYIPLNSIGTPLVSGINQTFQNLAVSQRLNLGGTLLLQQGGRLVTAETGSRLEIGGADPDALMTFYDADNNVVGKMGVYDRGYTVEDIHVVAEGADNSIYLESDGGSIQYQADGSGAAGIGHVFGSPGNGGAIPGTYSIAEFWDTDTFAKPLKIGTAYGNSGSGSIIQIGDTINIASRRTETIWLAGTEAKFYMWNGAATLQKEVISITYDGLTLSGALNLTGDLDITGNLDVSVDATVDGNLYVDSDIMGQAASGILNIGPVTGSTYDAYLSLLDTDILKWIAAGSEQFRVDASGNLSQKGDRHYFGGMATNDWIDLIDSTKAFRVVVDGAVEMLLDTDVAGSGFQVRSHYMQRVVEMDSVVSTTAPSVGALGDVISKTITVEADKPCHVFINGFVRASDVDEGELIGAYCIIDGDAVGQVSYNGFGTVTGSSTGASGAATGSHDHTTQGVDGSHTHAPHSHTITVSQADQYVTANSHHARTFTPTTTTITLTLQGYRSTSGIATFRNILTYQVWQDV